MARIRNIKPDFFDDPEVCELSAEAALVFIGLWTQADRAGRLIDEPRRLKIRLRPMSDSDMNVILAELEAAGFIVRYEVSGQRLIQVRSFEKHQRPHKDEKDSQLPPVSAETRLLPCKPVEVPAKTPETEMETETETETETEVPPADAAATPDALMAAWNSITHKPIPRCRELTKARRKHAKARLAERPLPEWEEVIARIQGSRFCRGGNDRGWVATFDWLLQADTAVKVLEGKYDDRGGASQSTAKPLHSPAQIRELARALGPGSWASECAHLHGGQCGSPQAHEDQMAVAS